MAYDTLDPSGSGSLGDVVGPASSTDNAVARFDTTTGKLLQNSVVTVDDTGATTGITTLNASTSVTTAAESVTYSTASDTPASDNIQASTGDAAEAFILTAGNSYAIGIDNSDSDKFKLSYNAAGAPVLGTSDLVAITTAGAMTVTGSITSSAALVATTSLTAASASITYSDTSTTPALSNIQASTGDVAESFILTGANSYAIGIDNSDSDKFKISYNAAGAPVLGTSDVLSITTAGTVGVGALTATSTAITVSNLSTEPQSTIRQNSDGNVSASMAFGNGSQGFVYGMEGGVGTFKVAYEASATPTLASATDVFTITSTGTATATALTATAAVTGNTVVSTTSVTAASEALSYSNTSTTPAASSTQASTGDAAEAFILTGGTSYALGIDNSDSDKFKISYNAAGAPVLGTSDLVTVSTAGDAVITGGVTAASVTSLGAFSANSLVATTSITGASESITYSTASTAPASDNIQASTGDAAEAFILTGGNSYAIGIDNSDSDKFKLSYNAVGAPVLGTSDLVTVTTAGAMTVTGNATADSLTATNAVTGNTVVSTTSVTAASESITYSNTSTTPASSNIQASTGDAAESFILTGAASYAIGIDNSDSDKFKVSYNATGVPVLGTSDALTIDSTGIVLANTALGLIGDGIYLDGSVRLGSANTVKWADDGSASTGPWDISLERVSAGRLQLVNQAGTGGRLTVGWSSTGSLDVGTSAALSDAAGVLSLTNVDALDATTAATVVTWTNDRAPVTTAASGTVTLTAADAGKTFVSTHGSGTVTYALPAAVAGLRYTFIVNSAFTATIDAAVGDFIYNGTTASTDGGTMSADAVGETMTIYAADGVNWIATSSIGTWTAA